MGYSDGDSGDIGGSNNSSDYTYGGFYSKDTGYTSQDYSYGGYYNENTGYTSSDSSYGGSYNGSGGKKH